MITHCFTVKIEYSMTPKEKRYIFAYPFSLPALFHGNASDLYPAYLQVFFINTPTL
jgi:hypothetical protein